MGHTSLEMLKKAYPQLEGINEPACHFAELHWIKYLTNSLVQNAPVSISTLQISETNTSAQVITKRLDGDKSYSTRLVLRCEEQPEYEGAILSYDGPVPLRPFCLGARYDKMPRPYSLLIETITKVGISHIEGANLDHIVDRLLLMNHLRDKVGGQFWENLRVYTQHLNATGDIKNVWLDD